MPAGINVLSRLVSPQGKGKPASPVLGELWLDTETNVLYYYNGTEWVSAKGTTGETGAAGAGIIACRLATAAALAAYTRTTNKLEANANGTMAAIDGVTPAVNDVFLLKDGAATKDNGPYKVTSVGSAGAKWTAERIAQFDASEEAIPGMLLTVAEGSKNRDQTYQLTTDAAITLNTTGLTFTRITPRDYGVVEALPTEPTPVKGDRCTFKTPTTGFYWQLIYTEEETYPWAKIGGPPLFAATGEVTSEKEALTAGPSITVPLAMEALSKVGSGRAITSGGAFSYIALTNNGTVEIQVIAGAGTQDALIGAWQNKVTKSKAVRADYARIGGTKAQFVGIWVEVDPIRVG